MSYRASLEQESADGSLPEIHGVTAETEAEFIMAILKKREELNLTDQTVMMVLWSTAHPHARVAELYPDGTLLGALTGQPIEV